MKNIEFKAVKKKYDETTVIQELNFSIKEGERLVLLGPSGCGKTTTLRMIAGLEEISEGQLLMGGAVVNNVAPGKRNIAMVFQNYALFPHLSVWENITFGLKIQKLTEQEMAKRVKEALEILNLTGYENRKPKELSGGQKQRVALCRAIVKQSPYFLLDEPLSNLDAQLRQQARTELVKLHEIYKPTMIYVTHDQVEAMTIAQRIAIMNKGELQQIDTPENIYHRPANTFVASFIGTPPMNLFRGRLEPAEGGFQFTDGDGGLSLRVTDDGRGFDPDAVGAGHYGLVGMRERAGLLGGSLLVDSRPGRTSVRLEVRR